MSLAAIDYAARFLEETSAEKDSEELLRYLIDHWSRTERNSADERRVEKELLTLIRQYHNYDTLSQHLDKLEESSHLYAHIMLRMMELVRECSSYGVLNHYLEGAPSNSPLEVQIQIQIQELIRQVTPKSVPQWIVDLWKDEDPPNFMVEELQALARKVVEIAENDNTTE